MHERPHEALDGFFRDAPETVRYGVAENLYGFEAIAAFRIGRAGGSPQRSRLRTEITTFGQWLVLVPGCWLPSHAEARVKADVALLHARAGMGKPQPRADDVWSHQHLPPRTWAAFAVPEIGAGPAREGN